jgi:phosphohistidine phosphatase
MENHKQVYARSGRPPADANGDRSDDMGVNLKKLAKKARHYDHVLLVMRHAKPEASNEGGDYARELTDKGRKQAKKMAKGLSDMDLVPDSIACSSATRAEQTLDRMLKIFGDKPKVDYRQSLYDGGLQGMFDELAHAKEKTRVLMILGHEPTVSMASQWLTSEDSDSDSLDLLNLGLSPSAVVVFGANKPFNAWQTHDAELLAVLNPKNFE